MTRAEQLPDLRVRLAPPERVGDVDEGQLGVAARVSAAAPESFPDVAAQQLATSPLLRALAVIRERQGRLPDAVALRRKIYAKRAATPAELLRLGEIGVGSHRLQGSFPRLRPDVAHRGAVGRGGPADGHGHGAQRPRRAR